jgi:acyl dehydratase
MATGLYFEDFAPGQVHALGSYTVEAREIMDFARQWDPQPFHTDPEAAGRSHFGGLVASGWHTASIFMRLYVKALLADSSSMGSPGIHELRWLAPVRPGDILTGMQHVEDVTPSSKRADRGTVHFRSELVNQDGVVVLSLKARGMFGRRAPAAA